MRFSCAIGFLFSMLGCSDPRLEFHTIRSADSPIKTEVLDSAPCEDCISQSWIAHDGAQVTMQIDREPFLSIPADRLSQPELIHGKWIYQPYCDTFSLSFRLGISLAEVTDIVENHSALPSAAIVNGRTIDVGRHMVDGETVSLAFGERQEAADVAEMLGATLKYREADDSWRDDVRRQRLRILDEIFADPARLRQLASESGLRFEDLDREEIASSLLCP